MRPFYTAAIVCCTVLFLTSSGWTMQGSDQGSHNDMTAPHAGHSASGQEMDHSAMQHGSSSQDGHFMHAEMVDGIHAEFQVMELAAMNMTDPQGKSHHVMASFLKNDSKLEQAVGKVKLIAPSGKEQTATLTNYGSGVFAANFTIDEPGKWGVICLFKDDAGATHTVKFWYPHGE
jgi:hypothetical protein